MNPTNFRFYKTSGNSKNEHEFLIIPYAGNTPYNHKEISRDEYVSGLAYNRNREDQEGEKQRILSEGYTHGDKKFSFADIVGTDTGFGQTPYTINSQGVPQLITQIQQEEKNKMAVASGTMTEIKPGMYVPTNSPGATNPLGVPAPQQPAANIPATPVPTNPVAPTPPVQSPAVPPAPVPQGGNSGIPPAVPGAPTPPSQVGNPAQMSATLPFQGNLQPGMNGTEVSALQNWLISQGYQIPDGATGFYGPQTTAAVAKWQQDKGVQAGQYAGYFGPLSRDAATRTNTPSSQINAPTGTTAPQGGSSTATDPFADRVQGILSTYGITPPDPTKSPINSFANTYKEMLDSLGYTDIKSELETIQKQKKDLDDELQEKLIEVNENPWLSEGQRSDRIQSLQSKYEAKGANLVESLKLYESLSNSAREDAQFIAGQVTQSAYRDQQLQQDMIFKAIDMAEKEIDAANKLDTEIIEVGGVKKLINSKTGETIRTLGKSDTGVGGLTPSQLQGAIDRVNDDFRQDPVTKQYTTAGPGWNFLSSINPNTKNPADNIGAIYAFAKIMDPESVVREGEYATVQKYAQSWLETFGFNVNRVFNNTEFLTPESIKNMQATAGAKFRSVESAYQISRSSFENKINDLNSGKVSTGLVNYGNFTSPTYISPALTSEDKTKALDEMVGKTSTQTSDPSSGSFFDQFLSVFGLKKN